MWFHLKSSTSYRFLSYLVRLHQLDLLLDLVESQVILALIKLASANIFLICRLTIQSGSVRFYRVEIDDRLFNSLLQLNLDYLLSTVGIEFYYE